MMIARASSSLAEGGQSTAGEGAGSFRAVHETHRQPRCVGEEEGCKQTSRRTTRGNRTRKGGGAWPPHEHHHVPCACCNHVHAVHAGCCRREGRGGVGCVVWAGRRRRERVLRVMMMRRPGLAGQSKANQSKQHRGKTAQWGRHNSRVHTRLAGQGIQKNKRTSFLVLAIIAAAASRRQRQDAVLEGAQTRIKRLLESTNLHIFVN